MSTVARAQAPNPGLAGFSAAREPRACAQPTAQDGVHLGALQGSLRAGGASVRTLCVEWEVVGRPSIGRREPSARPLRCVVMKPARLLVLALVSAVAVLVATGCGSSSSSGGEHDPAALGP